MAPQTSRRRWLTRIVGALGTVVLICGFVWFVRTMMSGNTGKTQRQVQVVQIIRPPPPPPPPPDQPPPPPVKSDEPLPKDQPEEPPPNDEPPPLQQLGVDAEGSAGGDEFGLAARRGGSDLVGGNGTNLFGWYTNRLNDAIKERLLADLKLAAKTYSASLRVWVASDGKVRVQLNTSTGNHEMDQRIEKDLAALLMNDAPPLEMPQPITLKISQHT